MADIASNDKRFIEEDILCFFRGDLMAFPILPAIRVVPVKAVTLVERVRALRHDHQYTIDITPRLLVRTAQGARERLVAQLSLSCDERSIVRARTPQFQNRTARDPSPLLDAFRINHLPFGGPRANFGTTMNCAQNLGICVGLTVLTAAISFPQTAPRVQDFPLVDAKALTGQGVKVEAVEFKGRKAVCLTKESYDEGYAIVNGTDFEDGTIEVELALKVTNSPIIGMPGFAGVAFRARPDASHYELFYLRPGNSSSGDQAVRNHSVQYSASPDYGWYKLRREWPWLYEAYAELQPETWTKVKVEVAGRKAKLYLHGSSKPALIVDGLKGEDLRGAVALWGFPGQETYFSNLRIKHTPPQPVHNGSDAAGKWEARLTTDAGTYGGLLSLTRDGGKVAGKWSGAFGENLPVVGTWRNGYVELQFTGEWTKEMPFGAPGKTVVTLAGWVDGSKAQGRAKIDGRANGQWAASRIDSK